MSNPLSLHSAFQTVTAPLVLANGQNTEFANITEGNDALASTSTPYTISSGDVFSGNIGSSGDSDYVAINLVTGQNYQFSLEGVSLSDPMLTLRNSSGTQIAFNDDGGSGRDSLITYTATSSGTYYLDASAYSNHTGTYRLTAAEVAAPEFASPQTLAAYLTDGYWEDNGVDRRHFDTSASNVLTVDLTDLTADGRQLARWALEAWENVVNIEFQEVTSGAKITFDDDEGGAFSTSVTNSNGDIISSHVNVSTAWLTSQGTTIDSYSFQTYIHEIGHALGLGHQGNYNGNASFPADSTFANDSWQMSIMSYFNQSDNTNINASLAGVVTAMSADIIAIQDLYGAPGANSATAGDTVYGANSNVSGYLGELFGAQNGGSTSNYDGNAVAYTLYDRNGTDTIDLSNSTVNNRLDLESGSTSDLNDLIGNLVIAGGTIIENAVGGSGNDTINGNDADNNFRGNAGNDRLESGLGNDLLRGGSGHDLLLGRNGNDTLSGNSGNDRLYGGGNNDRLFGGSGDDQMHGGSGNDELYANSGNDRMNGGSGVDRLDSGVGNDLLRGNSGNDLLLGRNGNDTLSGSSGNDRLYGGGNNDRLFGGANNDQLNGGSGADRLSGGGGSDILTGNSGADVFVFETTSGTDTVTDFTDGTDLILFDGGSFAELTITAVGSDVRVSSTSGGTMMLEDTTVSMITASDFIFS